MPQKALPRVPAGRAAVAVPLARVRFPPAPSAEVVMGAATHLPLRVRSCCLCHRRCVLQPQADSSDLESEAQMVGVPHL